ncbi:uncharacterized protein ACR2FA_010051 [Aphomia sociella]
MTEDHSDLCLWRLGQQDSDFLGRVSNFQMKSTPGFLQYGCQQMLADSSAQTMLVCWECEVLLLKVVQFQQHVRKANHILQMGQTNKLVESSDEHIDNEYNEVDYKDDDIKSESIKSESESIKSESESKPVFSKLDIKGNDSGVKLKTNNKWAKKRAIQNKKPKFRLVKSDEAFRTVQMSSEELRLYMEKERQRESYKSMRYKCRSCVIGFKKETQLTKHNFKNHRPDQPYVCDICNTSLEDKRHLSAHMEKHYSKYVCALCNFVCYDSKHVNTHVKAHRKVFECLKCGLKFGCRREFFKHFKEWHEKFTCDYCGISFKMRYCIKDHIRKQHNPFECKPCNKRFARYNGLWLHNKTHHTTTPPAAAYCVECDKRFADVYRYRWHLANSAKHRPAKKVRVPCPGCDKVFSKKIYMKDHYNLVHLKYYKYHCEECDKNFIRNADLVKHKRRVHDGILPPRNKICYMCGRGFTTNKILTNHIRTHTGERPYSCRCSAQFSHRAALLAHQRTCGRPRDPHPQGGSSHVLLHTIKQI